MKKKTYLRRAAALLLAVTLAGCSTATTDTSKLMTAGTYEGTAAGENGDVKVSVTVTTDSITSVEITEQSETAGIADDALQDIPQEIMDNQSLNVDLSTGATVTSKAIINAVADAITQAGGSADDWQTDKTGTAKTDVTEMTTEVVVIGSGASGLATTLRLEQLGVKTVLLEKNSYLGGTFAYSDGSMIVTGSELMDSLGGTDSAESLGQDLMTFGGSTGSADLLRTMAEHTGDTVDWMVNDLGVDFNTKDGLQSADGYSNDRVLKFDGSADKISDLLTSEIDVSGAKVMKSTRAIGLKQENGAVTGVIARSTSGKVYDITADYVVLATGGYGANESLTTDSLSGSLYGGSLSSTGDAIILGRDENLNVSTVSMSDAQYSYAGVALNDTTGVNAESANAAALDYGMIYVNSEGSRFVSETASNSELLGAEMMQTDGSMYVVMTQDAFNAWKEELSKRSDLSDEINSWLSNGVYKGSTLEEAAEAAGLDSTVLKNTADIYDSMIAGKEDTVYGRDSDHLGTSFKESGSYYIVKEQPCYYTTLGGISVNANLEVLNSDGNVIQGLYAVGECVGGVFGSQTSQDAENTWSFVSGKLIADQIYDDQTASAAESASPSADPSAAAASSEPTASAN